MVSNVPPEIKSGLVSLRRRIRKIQIFRGLLRTTAVFLAGLLVIVALDYFLAPLPSFVRAILFFLWIAAMVLGLWVFLFRPLLGKLPLLRLARWLEERHPETEERISTALELSSHPEGVSPALLAELSDEAINDINQLDPRDEVQTKRVRRSFVPVGVALLILLSLFALWPREMGRLLTRAVTPFSDLGNVGAFRFEVAPGDVEVLEGDELTIALTYTGHLDRPLEFFIEKDGELVSEVLQPLRSEKGVHEYSYTIPSADKDFRYSARVARSESDRFEAKVYSLPRLLKSVVTLQYPAYTGWPDREVSLGSGIAALAGTEVTVEGLFETPIEEGQLMFDSESYGEMSFETAAKGSQMSWSGVLKPGLDRLAVIKVKHRLGRLLEGSQFHLLAEEDPAPVVKILTPVQRQFRVKPDDQITITYEVVERIGLAKAEIELEVNGKRVPSLPDFLPVRSDGEKGKLWEGEAMVFLGTLLEEHQGARKFRMRLALSDSRPSDLAGPGVGYSEWLEFQLDAKAESLVRQELRKQDQDLRDTLSTAIRDLQKAKQKMYESKGALQKEELPEWTEKALTESRDHLQEAQKKLAELKERMKQGIQNHRRDELEDVIAKVQESQESVEGTFLQDAAEARHSELDHAVKVSEEAIEDLQKIRSEVQQDRPQMDDLAKLQELAQRQEELARQASRKEADQDWQNKQRRMLEEIRRKVKESPEARAAAMASQSEQAKAFAEEAGELQRSQKELSQAVEARLSESLQKVLAREQKAVAEAAKEELSKARAAQESRANDLSEVLAQAEEALGQAESGNLQAAAEAALQSARELDKGSENSPTQMALKEKQSALADALQDLSEGRAQEALASLEEMQAERAQELAQEIDAMTAVEGDPFRQAEQKVKEGAQKAAQAGEFQKENRGSQASRQHEQSAQSFAEAKQALEQVAEQLAQRAEQIAKESEDGRKAPAPGRAMAKALEESSQAVKAGRGGEEKEASQRAEAAAKALRKAANEAKARMKRGAKPGEENEPAELVERENGEGEAMDGDADEGTREKQEGQGVPLELAKLGVSAADWEKIKATMQNEVGGSRRSLVPEDYRGLVKEYFEQITKQR